jgi:trimethylamine--corrinoid protein Co-methyltransferase
MARLNSKIEVLSPEEIEAIHVAAVNIVCKVGMMVGDEGILQLMKSYGCPVEDNIVKFPRDIVDSYLEDVWRSKENVSTGERFPGEDLQFFASGQAAYACDIETGQLYPSTSKDLADLGRVVDAIPGLRRSHPTFVPQDVPELTKDVHILAITAMSYSEVHGGTTSVYSSRSLPFLMEIGTIIRGSKEALRKKPCFQFGAYLASPFRLARDVVSISLEMMKLGLFGGIANMVVAGASAPITLAGTLVVQTAENIAAGIINKAMTGNIGGYGGGPLILDMRSGSPAEGAPESLLLRLATSQICEFYTGSRTTAIGGHVSAQFPGLQAGIERSIGILFGLLAGQRAFGAFGSLACGDVGSIVQLMIDLEIGECMRRLLRGITVTDETIAEEVIIRAGIGANFLGNPHTIRNIRKEIWFPELMDRRTVASFMRDPKTMLENAREKAIKLVKTAPNRSKLDETQIGEIKKVVERADREAAGD